MISRKKKAFPVFLTKNLFVKASECPTKMYYAMNPEYPDITEQDEFYKALQEGGFQVEELAKLYHPGGINLLTKDKKIALETTAHILQEKSEIVIYEASVAYQNCFVRIDILEKTGNELNLIEVKAKSIDSTDYSFITQKNDIRSEWRKYLIDIAFQAFVLSKAYPNYKITPYIMLVDKSKIATINGLNQVIRINRDNKNNVIITHSKPNLTKNDLGEEILIKIPVLPFVRKIWEGNDISLSKKSLEEQKDFFLRIDEYADFCVKNKRFPITIGAKCKNCEYRVPTTLLTSDKKSGFQECWKTALDWADTQFLKPHVLDLWNFRNTQRLIDEGAYLLEQIDPNHVKLNKRQRLQIERMTTTQAESEFIDPDLFDELSKFKFPLHFIDFETSRVAIPFNKGRHPYELIAFQFSIHTLYEDGEATHSAEWINVRPGFFPNFEFIQKLKEALSKDEGTIFKYSLYENTVLNAIYDQLKAEASNIADAENLMKWIRTITTWKENGKKQFGNRNMVDMLDLVKQYYYHPVMEGSNSIKEVLFAVMNASDYLKQKYSVPYFGTNFPEGKVWIQYDREAQRVKSPYELLDPIGENILEIKEGGAAMVAYCKLQFSDTPQEERKALINGLLRYCELDTLAMLMIHEYWLNAQNSSSSVLK